MDDICTEEDESEWEYSVNSKKGTTTYRKGREIVKKDKSSILKAIRSVLDEFKKKKQF